MTIYDEIEKGRYSYGEELYCYQIINELIFTVIRKN